MAGINKLFVSLLLGGNSLEVGVMAAYTHRFWPYARQFQYEYDGLRAFDGLRFPSGKARESL